MESTCSGLDDEARNSYLKEALVAENASLKESAACPDPFQCRQITERFCLVVKRGHGDTIWMTKPLKPEVDAGF